MSDTPGRVALDWAETREGREIPPLDIRLTYARMLAAAAGDRNLAAVHSNRDFARAAGHQDIFLSNQNVIGLLSRFLTDWAGPEAFIRRFTLQMRKPCYLGDRLTIQGKVSRKYTFKGLSLLDVGMTCHDQSDSLVIEGDATVDLPVGSQKRGLWQGDLFADEHGHREEDTEPMSKVPQGVQGLIGREFGPQAGWAESNRWLNRNFTMPLEDGNPIYWDPDFAKSTRFGHVISPPGTLNRLAWGPVWPFREPPLDPFDLVCEALGDFPFNVMVSSDCKYLGPVYEGDRLHSFSKLATVSALKETRRGQGYFYSIVTTFWNQKGVNVAETINVHFRYRHSNQPRPETLRWETIQNGQPLPSKPVFLQMPPDDRIFAGYVRTFVRSWSGPEVTIESIDLTMAEKGGFSLNGYGEVLALSGEVVNAYRRGRTKLVDLCIQARNQGFVTATARTTIRLD